MFGFPVSTEVSDAEFAPTQFATQYVLVGDSGTVVGEWDDVVEDADRDCGCGGVGIGLSLLLFDVVVVFGSVLLLLVATAGVVFGGVGTNTGYAVAHSGLKLGLAGG